MRILVTNDDGIDAPGISSLASALASAGHDVVVVAPDREMSGAASAMGPLRSPDRLDFEPRTLSGVDVEAYAVEGPPAICVIGGLLGGFGAPPTLIASGVNPGHNTGRSILHSGTVGAALTAAAWGCSGVAVSIGTGPEIHWASASALAVSAAGWLETAGPGTALNLNVPNRPLAAIAGVSWAEPAPFGSVRTQLVARNHRHLDLEMADVAALAPGGSDTATVAAGQAAVTLLDGPRTSASEHRESLSTAVGEWLC